MIILGLTGGIGSGKTFVANEFKKKGIPVYNSDIRAKELMETNPLVKSELQLKFGSDVFIGDKLNRKLIADQIFSNKTLITWINELIHPIVQLDFETWVTKQNTDFVIKEAAILIESGAYKQCHKIIVVEAPEKLRVKRVVERDNMEPNLIYERIKNQMTDKERLKYSDFIIINDGIKVVSEQVEKIYNELLQFVYRFPNGIE